MKSLLRLAILLAIIAAVLFQVVWKARPVQTYDLARGTVVREALGSGSIESRRMVGVGFEVTSRVAEILVDQGDSVVADQILARLDDKTFKAEVDSARKELALVASTIKRLEAEIARALAVLEGARDGLRRVLPLVEAGTVSEERLDLAREREKVALAELASTEAALAEGQAATALAGSKLARSEVELARTVLRSPFAGTVVLREREVGDVAVPGAPVLRLAASATIWASVWVDESYLSALKVGLSARVVLRSDPERAHVGQVARIGREVDRETRELLVDVRFKSLPAQLVFGQRVDLWIELFRAEQVLRLPAQLLVRQSGVAGVLVERDGRAQFQALQLGLSGGEFLEIMGGLVAGDAVIRPGLGKRRVRAGERSRFKPRRVSESRYSRHSPRPWPFLTDGGRPRLVAHGCPSHDRYLQRHRRGCRGAA